MQRPRASKARERGAALLRSLRRNLSRESGLLRAGIPIRKSTCHTCGCLLYCESNGERRKTSARWQSAGLLDESTAAAIRAYETKQAKPQGPQWQVLLALILGGILLGAGVLLFVAANWDKVSPATRLITGPFHAGVLSWIRLAGA